MQTAIAAFPEAAVPAARHLATNVGPSGFARQADARGDVAGLPLAGQVLSFSEGSEIYAEGDDVRSFYKVVSGTVRTCKFLSDGRRQIDGFHAEGEIFGLEIGGVHGLSAEAVTDCTVIAYRWRGQAALADDGETARTVFSLAMQCLMRAQHHSLLLGRRSAAQKLAAFLIDMAGRRSANDGSVELAMTRQDIADYLGLTIETVSRTLSQFERDRLIALPAARRIVLKNRSALEDLGD
ncbi:helix-turn-helix domain-containing protein [Jiella sp. M17.18]|uniref:helix-turn-helix domain-containing protein n=1 Tax=Jiella sp. M17.18 TaxID=3234247 RepID=UPI0034DF3DC2